MRLKPIDNKGEMCGIKILRIKKRKMNKAVDLKTQLVGKMMIDG
jgi:hypothetical protein